MYENIIFLTFRTNCPPMKYTASWNNKFPDTKKYSKHKCDHLSGILWKEFLYYFRQTT